MSLKKPSDSHDRSSNDSVASGSGSSALASKVRVIFVEDEEYLRDVLVAIHTRFGHEVRGAADGEALDSLLHDYIPDVVVLDLNLPGEDGISISRRLRSTLNCGIIMTSGRGKLKDRLDGFESGADLYFVKPIEPVELNAAIENLARRIRPASPAIKPEWYFDQLLSTLTSPRGVGIDLTGQESLLMELFVASPGHIVHRPAIFAALEHPDDAYAGKKVETLVSRLRAKARRLDPLSELPIRARHSQGYAFLAALND